jgi:polyhydroxybutyrate depolymerase
MRNGKRVVFTLAFLLVFAHSASARLINKTIDVDGVIREYLVYLPAGYDGSTPMPVMLTYHGGDMTSLDMLLMADMRPLADANGFILVYPQGLEDAGSTI